MSVTWTQEAEDQLTAAYAQIARGGSPAATTWAQRVRSRTDSLAGLPGLGAEVPEYADPAVRELYEHPYRTLYRVDGADVVILSVFHSARRLPRTPPG